MWWCGSERIACPPSLERGRGRCRGSQSLCWHECLRKLHSPRCQGGVLIALKLAHHVLHLLVDAGYLLSALRGGRAVRAQLGVFELDTCPFIGKAIHLIVIRIGVGPAGMGELVSHDLVKCAVGARRRVRRDEASHVRRKVGWLASIECAWAKAWRRDGRRRTAHAPRRVDEGILTCGLMRERCGRSLFGVREASIWHPRRLSKRGSSVRGRLRAEAEGRSVAAEGRPARVLT